MLFSNPLHTPEQEAFFRLLIARDVQRLLAAKPLLWNAAAFYSFTRFIWRVGARTITMPTVSLEEQSRGCKT